MVRCFIFNSWRDAEVYAYLTEARRCEVDEIEANAKAAKVFDDDANSLNGVSEIMADKLRMLFENDVPCDAEGWPALTFAAAVYRSLFRDAMDQVNFRKVAEAFLQNVELPESQLSGSLMFPLPDVI